MKQETNIAWIAGILGIVMLASFTAGAFAQEDEASEAPEAAEWKARLDADKAAISAQKKEMKSNAETARSEEKALLEQIRTAERSGDHATAKSLRSQLKSTHKDNVSEMKSDKAQLKESKQEMKSDRKAAQKDRVDRNDDGAVDRAERKAAKGARGGRK